MMSCTASCAVTPSVMASSLAKVSPTRAQHLLHHVAQFKALHLRLGGGSWSPHLVRCSSDTGECAVVLPHSCLAGCLRVGCLQLHISHIWERQLTERWSYHQLEEWTLFLAQCLLAKAASCYGV